MRIIIIALLLLIQLSEHNAQSVTPDYFREEIKMELTDEIFTVTGTYYYRNQTSEDQEIKMVYPFPNDKTYGLIDNVFAFDLQDSLCNVLINWTQQAAMIKLKVTSYGQTALCIGYTQELHGNKAEYILKTTRKWEKVLEKASFELIFPVELKIDSLTYKPIDTLILKNIKHLYFEEVEFWPENDFQIYFSSRN